MYNKNMEHQLEHQLCKKANISVNPHVSYGTSATSMVDHL